MLRQADATVSHADVRDLAEHLQTLRMEGVLMFRRTFLKSALGAIAAPFVGKLPAAAPVEMEVIGISFIERPIFHDLYGYSPIDIETFLVNEMSKRMAEQLDQQMMLWADGDTDSPEPLGLLNVED